MSAGKWGGGEGRRVTPMHGTTNPIKEGNSLASPALQISKMYHLIATILLCGFVSSMIRAINSFPAGSAGGPDGLWPQHFKDLIAPGADDSRQALVPALVSFTELVLNGKTPASIRPFFFGATLIALEKKGGGVRPIAVGGSLRRLIAKVAGMKVMNEMGGLLAPVQLGYGVHRGAEAAVHAASLYIKNLGDKCVLKLDFKNAFNSVRRDKMLEAVQSFAPSLFPFVHSVYSSPSKLFWEDKIIESAEGVQQGDPLGPLLFCLTIHQLCSRMKSELSLFYLDDGTLGGKVEDVLHDLDLVEREGAELGLILNHQKSEIISSDNAARGSVLCAIPGARVIDPEKATLLGSPVGDIDCISAVLEEKIGMLKTMGERLKYLFSHDAILLLRHSFAIPKLLYNLRTSPCFLSPKLQEYDNLLRSIVSSIVNIRFGEDDPAWTQATLPVKSGGLGIRSAVQLAPSAYMASAAACSELVSIVLPPQLQDFTASAYLDEARAQWSCGHDLPPPEGTGQQLQKAWDAVRVTAIKDKLLQDAPDARSRARLLASSARESGVWLNAPPSSSLGLRMDDTAIRVAVGLRLGCTLCKPHNCHHCGAAVDALATHGLSCKQSEGRHFRHSSLNDIIHRALSAAKIPSRLEPAGMYRNDGKRPDGITMVPWERGKLLVWDATCSDTFAPSYLASATSEAGAVASLAESRKRAKYANLDPSHLFQPVAVETSGAFGPDTFDFVKELGRRISRTTGESRSFPFLIQRLAVAIQRANSACVVGSLGSEASLEDFFV